MPIFTMDDNTSGMSQDDLILEFRRLDANIKEFSGQRKNIASQLTEMAYGENSGQNTVHLTASAGQKVKVTFGKEWKVTDQAEIECARELLGEELFRKVFKVEYTPKVRELKSFLSTKYSDERAETGRKIVAEFVKETEKTPYVSAE